MEADVKYLPNDDILLRRSKVEVPTIFGTNKRGCFYFRRMSSSNNTYFDVLRIVQHLINPHVPLSKRPGLKPSRLVRSACSPVDTPSRFQKF